MAKYSIILEDTDEQSGSYSVHVEIIGSDAAKTGVVSAAVLSGAFLRAEMDSPEFLTKVLSYANAQLESADAKGEILMPTIAPAVNDDAPVADVPLKETN